MKFLEWLRLDEMFAYKVPTDKSKQMYDFYMLSMIAGVPNPRDEKSYARSSGNDNEYRGVSQGDRLDYAVEEAKGELLPALKENMLDAVFFSLSVELRHVFTNNGLKNLLGELKENLGDRAAESMRKFFKHVTVNQKNEYKPFVRKPEGSRGPDMKASSETYMASYYAASSAAEGDKRGFVQLMQWVYSNAQWSTSYGGKPWANIAAAWLKLNAAKSYNEMSVWIDHVYDLQHNTGTVFNKLSSYLKEGSHSWLKKALDHKAKIKDEYELIDHVSGAMRELAAAVLKHRKGTTLDGYMKKKAAEKTARPGTVSPETAWPEDTFSSTSDLTKHAFGAGFDSVVKPGGFNLSPSVAQMYFDGLEGSRFQKFGKLIARIALASGIGMNPLDAAHEFLDCLGSDAQEFINKNYQRVAADDFPHEISPFVVRQFEFFELVRYAEIPSKFQCETMSQAVAKTEMKKLIASMNYNDVVLDATWNKIDSLVANQYDEAVALLQKKTLYPTDVAEKLVRSRLILIKATGGITKLHPYDHYVIPTGKRGGWTNSHANELKQMTQQYWGLDYTIDASKAYARMVLGRVLKLGESPGAAINHFREHAGPEWLEGIGWYHDSNHQVLNSLLQENGNVQWLMGLTDKLPVTKAILAMRSYQAQAAYSNAGQNSRFVEILGLRSWAKFDQYLTAQDPKAISYFQSRTNYPPAAVENACKLRLLYLRSVAPDQAPVAPVVTPVAPVKTVSAPPPVDGQVVPPVAKASVAPEENGGHLDQGT